MKRYSPIMVWVIAWITAGSVVPIPCLPLEAPGGMTDSTEESDGFRLNASEKLDVAECRPEVEMTCVACFLTVSRDFCQARESALGVDGSGFRKLLVEVCREMLSGGPMSEARMADPAEVGAGLDRRFLAKVPPGVAERETKSLGGGD